MEIEVTIDELAEMVVRGFSESVKKADLAELKAHVDERFETVNANLSRVENRLNSIEDRILADLTLRVARLEKQRTAA